MAKGKRKLRPTDLIDDKVPRHIPKVELEHVAQEVTRSEVANELARNLRPWAKRALYANTPKEMR